jgi:hypothetical protein
MRQNVPGIADQQRDEENHRDENRQHHFRRHAHAPVLPENTGSRDTIRNAISSV